MSQTSSFIELADDGRPRSPTSFDIVFAPILQVVSTMRRFVLALYDRILQDPSFSAQMALVTHELLENAIKYNIDDGALLRVSLTTQTAPVPGTLVVIRTRNRAAVAHIRVAADLIARVRDAADPEALYRQIMRSSLEQTEGSGLGLARIRAETAMSIDVRVDGDAIEVLACALLPIGGVA